MSAQCNRMCASHWPVQESPRHLEQEGEGSGRYRGGEVEVAIAYLEQSSQAIFPVVSLMVRSETNAGYSVSQGSKVCFNFWAVKEKEQEEEEKKKKI